MNGLNTALLAAAFALASVHASAADAAQDAPPAHCPASQHHQMDFWLGTWDVRWDATASTPAGQGTNTITREYGGCVIQEAFDGGPITGGLIGHSVSVFHAPMGQWRQTWVDNQGGYIALTGGLEGADFVLNATRLSDAAPHHRMRFENITPDTLTWRWQRSADGGDTWNDSWVIFYTRKADVR
jgi:hypothetical protein